jgi:gluconate 2-dehydrogenase gamma chain
MWRGIPRRSWTLTEAGQELGDGHAWGRFFSARERAFLIAFCDRLIPGCAAGPGAISAGVPQFIDRHMATPYAKGELWYRQGPFIETLPLFGYQGPLSLRQLLRAGIGAVEDHCQRCFGCAFAGLSTAEQEHMMRRIERGEVEFATTDPVRFFALLLAETRIGYFSDPVHGANRAMGSWAMIGYPGYPADYRAAIRERELPYGADPRSVAMAGQ